MLVRGNGEGPYFLWPNGDGVLSLEGRYRGRLNGLRLRRLQHSRRAVMTRALSQVRSQSLSLWLLSKSWGVVGFGAAKVSLFEMWLSAQLENSDFNALELDCVVAAAVTDLGLDLASVLGLLVRVTRVGARFKSDGELITFQ